MRERPKGSGRWQIGITLPKNAEGKYPQVTETLRLDATLKDRGRSQAKKQLNALIVRYQDVLPGADVGLTLAGALTRHQAELAFQGKAPRYLQQVGYISARIAAHPVGQMKLAKLRPSDLLAYYRELAAGGLSNTTVRRYHAAVSGALRHAESVDLLPVGHNPARAVKLPRDAKHEIVPPTPLEVHRLLAAGDKRDDGFGVFLHLAATLGARDGELCGLTEDSLLFVSNEIVVATSITHVRGKGVQVKETKGRNRRRVKVDQATMDRLFTHLEWQRDRAASVGVELDENPFLFSHNLNGAEPWSPDWASRQFLKVKVEAGVSCRLHDLRHFVASQLLQAGVPVTEVSARLGHKSTRMTLDVYGHFIPSDDTAAADLMARLLAQPATR
jgi:integrase